MLHVKHVDEITLAVLEHAVNFVLLDSTSSMHQQRDAYMSAANFHVDACYMALPLAVLCTSNYMPHFLSHGTCSP